MQNEEYASSRYAHGSKVRQSPQVRNRSRQARVCQAEPKQVRSLGQENRERPRELLISIHRKVTQRRQFAHFSSTGIDVTLESRVAEKNMLDAPVGGASDFLGDGLGVVGLLGAPEGAAGVAFVGPEFGGEDTVLDEPGLEDIALGVGGGRDGASVGFVPSTEIKRQTAIGPVCPIHARNPPIRRSHRSRLAIGRGDSRRRKHTDRTLARHFAFATSSSIQNAGTGRRQVASGRDGLGDDARDGGVGDGKGSEGRERGEFGDGASEAGSREVPVG